MPAVKGAGLLKGLGVTFRTMSRRAATAQYPHVRPDLPARTRGVIALVEENCTVCMLCSRECPDWCIYIDSHKEQVAPKEGGRARTRNVLDRFAIDFALCMYCGICVEVCPFDALYWSPEFEYAEYSHEPLTHEKERLREWAYTVPAPDPLEEGSVEPAEYGAIRKAREAAVAKAAAAAEAARKAAAERAAPAETNGGTAAPAASAPAGAGTAPAEPAAPATPAKPAAPARQPEVHVEPGIDKETFERLVAAGESERTARAKAKAAYMRKAKAEARAKLAAGEDAPANPEGSREPQGGAPVNQGGDGA
jgi:NADH-quinone oxidoreductase subunit I